MQRLNDGLGIEGSFAKRYGEGRVELLTDFNVTCNWCPHYTLAILNRSNSAIDDSCGGFALISNLKIGNAGKMRTWDE